MAWSMPRFTSSIGATTSSPGAAASGGFVLLGEAPTEEVESAVVEALESDESRRAASWRFIPIAAPTLVTTGFLATAVAFLGFAGRGLRRSWERFPTMVVAMMAVVLPVDAAGHELAEAFHDREGDLGDLELVSVTRDTKTLPFKRTSR